MIVATVSIANFGISNIKANYDDLSTHRCPQFTWHRSIVEWIRKGIAVLATFVVAAGGEFSIGSVHSYSWMWYRVATSHHRSDIFNPVTMVGRRILVFLNVFYRKKGLFFKLYWQTWIRWRWFICILLNEFDFFFATNVPHRRRKNNDKKWWSMFKHWFKRLKNSWMAYYMFRDFIELGFSQFNNEENASSYDFCFVRALCIHLKCRDLDSA